MVQNTTDSDTLRFAFGENWKRFLSVLTDERIAEAQQSLRKMLQVEDLQGKRFLDIGSGSGLFSLAARMLGAQVVSFDYDPQSVACTAELKRRYFPDDADWTVLRGSVLDAEFMSSLETFDVVYSWGVLHHTGALWQAMENAVGRLGANSIFFIAIYNDQGRTSLWWTRLKKLYNSSAAGKALALGFSLPAFVIGGAIKDLLRLSNPLRRYRDYHRNYRGMSYLHNIVDWVGGYPFEVARPEDIFRFCRDRGLTLTEMITCGGGLGCNEFVFKKTTDA